MAEAQPDEGTKMIMKDDQTAATPGPAPKPMWAYAYEIRPSQSADRLRSIQALLDRGNADAHDQERMWKGHFVSEECVTHILVVTDSPDADGEINRQLEAGMKKLDAPYSRTAPLAVVVQPE